MPRQPRALVAAVDLGLRLRAKVLRYLAHAARDGVPARAPDVPQRLPARPDRPVEDARRAQQEDLIQGAVRCLSRPSIYEQEHEDFREDVPGLHGEGGRPAPRPVGEGRPGQPRGVAQGRRGRAAVLRRRRGVRRDGRQGLPLQHGAHRGDHPRRRERRRLPGAQRRDRPLHQPPRDAGAEAALAARPGQRRAHLGHRDDRAGRRLGPAGHPHERRRQGRPLRRQRLQDVHQQRDHERPGDRRVAARTRTPATRASA